MINLNSFGIKYSPYDLTAHPAAAGLQTVSQTLLYIKLGVIKQNASQPLISIQMVFCFCGRRSVAAPSRFHACYPLPSSAKRDY